MRNGQIDPITSLHLPPNAPRYGPQTMSDGTNSSDHQPGLIYTTRNARETKSIFFRPLLRLLVAQVGPSHGDGDGDVRGPTVFPVVWLWCEPTGPQEFPSGTQVHSQIWWPGRWEMIYACLPKAGGARPIAWRHIWSQGRRAELAFGPQRPESSLSMAMLFRDKPR